MVEYRLIAIALFAASVSAGVVPTYPGGPLAYSAPIAKISAPLPYAAPPLQYAAAPVTKAVYAPGAPVAARLASPYAAPLGYASAPVAYAAPAYAHGPVVAKAVAPVAVDTDYDPNPSYSYAYDVQDALTGDSKNQQESRQGDVVQGSYSLTEPDGTRRTVEYTADPHNGFNAVVHREPAVVQKAVHAAPLAYAAPAYKVAAPAYKVAAPVAYAAHSAPLAYASHTPAVTYSHAAPAYAYHH